MTGEKSMFLVLRLVEGGSVAFGGMGNGKITGICIIAIPS